MTIFPAVALSLGPLLLLIAALHAWKRRLDRDDRRDPINVKVLRGAGDGLRDQITQLREEFDLDLTLLMFAGPFLSLVWAYGQLVKRGFEWGAYEPRLFDWVLLGVLAGWVIHAFRKMTAHILAARKYRQGLAAELAIGHLLNQVTAEGGYVFHDLPAGKFNIDHIVVGRSAVFAIETKSRLKPAKRGKDSSLVTYDGSKLVFPAHTETKPLEQARAQADWLRSFIASGIGEPAKVLPYLAIPGWWVEQKGSRHEVLVGNLRNPVFMMGDSFGPPLGEILRRRIAHVLAERYPDASADITSAKRE